MNPWNAIRGIVSTPALPKDLPLAFAMAPRKVTGELTAEHRAALESAGASWLAEGSSLAELARISILARACEVDDPAAVAAEWYRLGDNGEKRAVLRALAVLPKPESYVEVAATACRSSVQSVFDALCCENPYPAEYLSDLAFNQMVLKALFTDVRLERIVRLDDRKNAELARMANGYASERRAAGRSVPVDIGRVS